ncbi:MAG: NAD(P)-binding domain-containing protein, partial [Bdellovibrionaceae bacterium]|nr:NAD(P)-binding domain-containing protein [Pseudobdellovibrionaceae bacterium]
AEYAMALLLTLNRKTHRAYIRTRELNFQITGLAGSDLYRKTMGILGTGRIGRVMAKISLGFGMRVLAMDLEENSELKALGVEYTNLDRLCRESDFISLHIPLNSKTQHIINEKMFSIMKPNCLLVNTGRGGLIDTKALIEALKFKTIAGAALDVYEEEEGVFFENFESQGIEDDTLARLLTFPNVLVSSHQGFFTHEALTAIASTTCRNIEYFASGQADMIPQACRVVWS